jgi:protein TonB
VLVGRDGTVGQVEIAQSSGVPELEAAAREAAKRWRFAPARRGEKPIEAWVTVPVEFTIETPR